MSSVFRAPLLTKLILRLRLPLPEEAPLQFRMLPEYLIENIAEYLEFVVR